MRAAAALAASLALACPAPQEPVHISAQITPRDTLSFPATPAGAALKNHLPNLFAVGPDAEVRYQASLNGLRALGPQAVGLLIQAYDGTDKPLYSTRWALVHTLAELRVDAAVPPLVRIANEPLPPPNRGVEDIFSPFVEEVVIRMTAIQGIGRLAARNDLAVQALGRLIRHPVAAIREEVARAVATAVRAARDPARGGSLRRLLPEGYPLELDPAKIRPMPPPEADPRLKPEAAEDSSAPRLQGRP